RKTLDWYVERFRKHSPEYLIGMEVANTLHTRWETYDEGLWDQLMARFMPGRPVWGFGTDDMHRLEDCLQSHTVFLLPSLSQANVREAMENGRFYFTKSTRKIDLREGPEGLDEFP